MKKTIFFCIFLLTGLVVNSQSVLMTINKDTIYTSNFENNHKKSLELLGTQQTIDNSIDFILLKQYSIKNNINDTPMYQSELAKQGEKLRDSLYYPTDIVEPLLKDYYDKIKTEKKIQLLIFKEEDLKNRDKKSKEKFINSVINNIANNPIKFEKAVEQFSVITYFEKPTFLDIFSLDKIIVDDIYKTPLNTVTLYKNENNYYLILVSAERKYLGEVVLDEILIKDTSEVGKSEIEQIAKEIQKGGDFIKLRQKYSKNLNKNIQTSNQYTDIANTELYEYTFNEVNKNVPIHEISKPIKVQNGYAIYKYYFRESYDTYSIARKKIYNRLKKSEEGNKLNTILVNEMKTCSFFKENKQEIHEFIESLPNTYRKFEEVNILDEKKLVTIDELFNLTNKSLLADLKEQLTNENYINKESICTATIDKWERDALLEYYKAHFYKVDRLKNSWENLKEQLLIKYSFALIANQAKNDLEGQNKFINDNDNTLTWNERIEGTFYYCLNTDVEKVVLQMLKEKKSVEDIKNHFKGKTELLIINQGKLTRESANLPKDKGLTKGIYIVDSKNRRLIIDINKIIKNDKMTLEELQSNYMNEYIDYKTTQIIDQLKKEATITINTDQLKKLTEKYH